MARRWWNLLYTRSDSDGQQCVKGLHNTMRPSMTPDGRDVWHVKWTAYQAQGLSSSFRWVTCADRRLMAALPSRFLGPHLTRLFLSDKSVSCFEEIIRVDKNINATWPLLLTGFTGRLWCTTLWHQTADDTVWSWEEREGKVLPANSGRLHGDFRISQPSPHQKLGSFPSSCSGRKSLIFSRTAWKSRMAGEMSWTALKTLLEKRPEPQIPLGHTPMQICTFKWTGDFARCSAALISLRRGLRELTERRGLN